MLFVGLSPPWHLGMLLRSYPRWPAPQCSGGYCLSGDDRWRYFWLAGEVAALAWICCYSAACSRPAQSGKMREARTELRAMREMQEARDRKAQRGLAMILEVSVASQMQSVGAPQFDRSAAPERLTQIQSSLSSRVVRQLARTLVRSGRTLDCTK